MTEKRVSRGADSLIRIICQSVAALHFAWVAVLLKRVTEKVIAYCDLVSELPRMAVPIRMSFFYIIYTGVSKNIGVVLL